MRSVRWLLLLVVTLDTLLVRRSCCVVMTTESASSSQEDSGGFRSDTENKFGDSFFQCYKDDRDSSRVLPCIEQSARAGLSAFFSKEKLEISEGLSLIEEDTGTGKDILDDPLFRDERAKSFVNAASSYLAARSLRWDMSVLYPGLVMRVGPTLTAGSGVLEFAMEPTRHYTDRGVGPGRLIMRQTVVPLLLGIKVSVAALVPILLFGVVILVKKALVLSQVSAVLSTILGFGSVAAAAASLGGSGVFAGSGFGGGVYPGAHGHIGDGLPLRHRFPHQITQLSSGPVIVDVPPPWSTSNRDAFRTEETSASSEKLPGEDSDHATSTNSANSANTRTQRKTKNPRGFLWEADASRVNPYHTTSNIFPRESE